jgi:hypothetical protein
MRKHLAVANSSATPAMSITIVRFMHRLLIPWPTSRSGPYVLRSHQIGFYFFRLLYAASTNISVVHAPDIFPYLAS